MRSYLTVRGLPRDVARKLEEVRRRDGRSLNGTVVDLLRRALGLSAQGAHDNGLGRFAGGWSDDDLRAFERDTAIFDRVDPDVWT